MARQLRPEEADVFDEVPARQDPDPFIQSLLEKQEEPLDLGIGPGVWFRGFPLGNSGS